MTKTSLHTCTFCRSELDKIKCETESDINDNINNKILSLKLIVFYHSVITSAWMVYFMQGALFLQRSQEEQPTPLVWVVSKGKHNYEDHQGCRFGVNIYRGISFVRHLICTIVCVFTCTLFFYDTHKHTERERKRTNVKMFLSTEQFVNKGLCLAIEMGYFSETDRENANQ